MIPVHVTGSRLAGRLFMRVRATCAPFQVGSVRATGAVPLWGGAVKPIGEGLRLLPPMSHGGIGSAGRDARRAARELGLGSRARAGRLFSEGLA